MSKSRLSLFVTIFLVSTWLLPTHASAQPQINEGGVLNAASYRLPGLPGSGIAQGSIFVIFGQNLGPASLVQVQQWPLPTNLAGTEVLVTANGVTQNCYLLYTLSTQVAALLPSSVPVGPATIQVRYNGQLSNSVQIEVVAHAFGIFSRNQQGFGPAIVQNYIDPMTLPVNGIGTPAHPGQTVIIWGTGLGGCSR